MKSRLEERSTQISGVQNMVKQVQRGKATLSDHQLQPRSDFSRFTFGVHEELTQTTTCSTQVVS